VLSDEKTKSHEDAKSRREISPTRTSCLRGYLLRVLDVEAIQPDMAFDRTAGDFGSRLRAARERRGLSLRQIAVATKISMSALEALERNDISRLPGGIFSRAFVRSYAVEVGLDPDATVQEFLAQFPGDTTSAGHPAPD